MLLVELNFFKKVGTRYRYSTRLLVVLYSIGEKNSRLLSLVEIGTSTYNTTTPWTSGAGRPGSSEVPRNPLTRWDVSSIPANGIFLTKKKKEKKKNAQRVEND